MDIELAVRVKDQHIRGPMGQRLGAHFLPRRSAHNAIVFIHDGNDFLGSAHVDETILSGWESVKGKHEGQGRSISQPTLPYRLVAFVCAQAVPLPLCEASPVELQGK